jgi:acyl-CoA reductase-like NAD-dependent aldehyde dehydrogenase
VSKIEVFNPATQKKVGEVQCSDLAAMPSMLEQAKRSQSEWMAISVGQRKAMLSKAQRIVVDRMEEIARTICEETGKPRLEAIANDIMAGLGVGDFCLHQIDGLQRTEKLHLGRMELPMRLLGRSSIIFPRPLGIIGIISPWNYPFGIPYSQCIMALAAGNAVMIKPSSSTPFSSLKLCDIFKEAGLPEHLVQVIIGSGETAGRRLITSGVNRIIFTGSTVVGKEVMALAAQNLTPVTLELGGKDPMIVMPDADIPRAVRAAVWGSFVNAGQTCACVKRILVHHSILEKFTDAMVERTQSLKIGYGWEDTDVSMGPLINDSALEMIEGMVGRAVSQGAKVEIGGKRPIGMKGYFFEPTILTNVSPGSEVFQEECFGPLVVLVPFSDEREAVDLAWNNRYALTASVWTKDVQKGIEIARRLPGGTVHVNNVAYSYGLGATPWGGSKDSGFGRTHGDLGFSELTEAQLVHVDKGGYAQDPWWSPYDKEKVQAVQGMLIDLFGDRSRFAVLKMMRLRRLMRKR